MLETIILILLGLIIILQTLRVDKLKDVIKIQDELIESQDTLISSNRKIMKEQDSYIIRLKTYIDRNDGEN